MDTNILIEKALLARKQAYCPYSGISVGAALLTKSGRIYTGANIESASFSPTVCAERVAFFSAIHDGERDFCAIAIVGGEADKAPTGHFPPCGVCRQVMAEFCRDDFKVILNHGDSTKIYTLGEMLPMSFNKDFI